MDLFPKKRSNMHRKDRTIFTGYLLL